ncbi:MAG: energy transducer TonB [Bacteroidota bacterium]
MRSLRLLFLLSLLLTAGTLAAQVKKDSVHDPQNMKVITTQEAHHPKGEQWLYMHIMYDLKYPEESKKKYVEGEVTVKFDVNTDSTVTDCQVISGVGYGIDEEVKKMLEKLRFAPAVQNGIRVKTNMMMTFPVKAH